MKGHQPWKREVQPHCDGRADPATLIPLFALSWFKLHGDVGSLRYRLCDPVAQNEPIR